MKTFRILGLALFAILLCLSACSGGNDDPIEPAPKPEVPKSEITIDSSIISNGLSFSDAGGEQSISFSTNENWTLSVASTTSGTTWCTASVTSGTKGSASVKFAVVENTTYDNRSVSVTIKSGTASKTFTISQKGVDALLVTTDKYEVAQEGGTISIEVEANINYQMEISETAKDWIKESSSRALTTYNHTLSIAANEETEKREGEIYFKSGDKVETVKIYQAGGAILLLTDNEYQVSDKGDTISVDIKSNIEFGVQMPDVDWIVDEASSRGLSSHTLKYIISANEGYDSRSASIVFFDKNSDLKDTLKVVQAQKDAIILSEKTFNLNAKADTIRVKLCANVEFEIEMPNIGWISKVSSRALTEHEVKFYVSENKSKEARNTKIIFRNPKDQTGDTIKINQAMSDEYIPYLTFVTDGTQRLSMTKAVSSLEYSVSNGGWHELGTDTIEFGGSQGALRIRGKSITGTATSYDDYSTFVFLNSDKVECTGDIRTLIDYENYTAISTSKAKYIRLFWGCSSLISAPELPAIDLAEYCYDGMFAACTSLKNAPHLPTTNLVPYCYRGMFSGCKSLINAPDLPATKIAEGCYETMFQECTSLINAPELPATILVERCYENMFNICLSLTTAPKLPAINLEKRCYQNMFSSCTSLVIAPELPAKMLKENCYRGMFSGCTSLTSAPELPATQLAKNCYLGMFGGCTSLTSAPELPATDLAEGCYENMFWECSSLVSAPELPAMNLAKNCYHFMFHNCTSLTSAPELPATSLAEWCYGGMFSGCTSLTSAPELPAISLAEYCYAYMFSKCTSLIYAPELSATNLANGCYSAMFYGTASLTSAPQLPATILAEDCYSFMFEGCSSLISAPKLLATDLVPRCYYWMFAKCSQLNNIIMLATNIEAEDCLSAWTFSIAKKGTFVKAETMTSLPIGSDGIPVHWTIKNYDGD